MFWCCRLPRMLSIGQCCPAALKSSHSWCVSLLFLSGAAATLHAHSSKQDNAEDPCCGSERDVQSFTEGPQRRLWNALE